MKTRQSNARLFLPLDATGISQAFTNLAEKNGFLTLAAILAIPVTDLLKIKGFTGSMLDELVWVVDRPCKKEEAD
jgi:hypothetical protein